MDLMDNKTYGTSWVRQHIARSKTRAKPIIPLEQVVEKVKQGSCLDQVSYPLGK